MYPHPSSPEASTPQASLVVERFVSIPYDYADKTIIAIHQNAVTASKIGLMWLINMIPRHAGAREGD